MSDEIDDNEEKKNKSKGESDKGSSSGESFSRASGEGLTRATMSEDEAAAARKKSRTGGDTDSGAVSVGTTFTRASGEGIAKLSVDKTKKVWADFRHLDLSEVVSAVAEFFSEFPARASANLTVKWNGSYALVNMAIKFGQDVAMAVRERTRESAIQIRKRYGLNIKVRRNGVMVSVPNPNLGIN
jgi:hypothetical protein